jgi:4'-phosphopantetheinyl transferase
VRASEIVGRAESAELEESEIHVWQLSVGRCRESLPECRALLSSDERARADRFAIAEPREQFTVARGSLRLILGGYLRAPAGSLRFGYGEYGKPALASQENLSFNVAHSGDAILIAVAKGFDLGVDVEQRRADIDVEAIGPQCLCPEEIERIEALESGRRRAAFFDHWTGKEALSKAVGSGLATPLTAIVVLDHGDEGIIEMNWHANGGTQRWFGYRIDAGTEYSAAVAAQSPSLRIRRFGTDLT